MDASIHHLEELIERLAQHTQQPKTHKGFKEMAAIVGVTEGYLYKNIFRGKELAKKKKQKTLRLHESNLDTIARHLGFRSFAAFTEAADNPLDPVTASLEGRYYCYVRRNARQTVVMRSPVRITRSNSVMQWELTGPLQHYKGILRLQHGCVFVLMESDGGKIIHHVYKIGTREKPEVMQGIFSGVSTGFDPIGGRVVLVRIDDAWENLTRGELSVENLKQSTLPWEQTMVDYFEKYGENNLLCRKSATFTYADLQP